MSKNENLIATQVAPTGKPGRVWKRYARWGLGLAGVAAAMVAIFVWQTMARHNFHVVSAGQVYRSAQPDAEGLKQMVRDHGIKSVLNLRGADGGDWYCAETNASQAMGLEHYDFKLSAGTELTDAEMEQILATIGHAAKPMLIHCKSGADRTGLVGALYLYSLEGKSAQSAGQELTVWRGHVPYLFWRDTIAMDRSYWRYVDKHAQRTARLNDPLARQD
jgi:protein tyrosine phosphatase (PTP) superfamily phosphohydrolase (DUF442 family)